jgi:hypothetical protein
LNSKTVSNEIANHKFIHELKIRFNELIAMLAQIVRRIIHKIIAINILSDIRNLRVI